ncbi:exodeoxyribonuclease V subunit beta [Candidatus Marithrix sp. Canyon 246]|uniref:exodeoxyribonuclease V subunit beta n=3 Tax=Candidatus Marithrix sp. Canyon 246 TaxID=1827136 RepID=UPI00084A1731|nr:exodeoxyribonuclease V subunit beta [Candidatus Marithrix sp. Canyon 246]
MKNTTIEKLEPLTIPLQDINLIEASAGTGKTHTITTLVLRLILEKRLTIDKILVVTFTETATEELRNRIRKRLHEAREAFKTGEIDDDDEDLAELIHKFSDYKDEAISRLDNALRGFDEAAIFTIHSFCRQMLQDYALESGVLFETELIGDQSPLLREIVEDFWRQNFYAASGLFITYLQQNKYKNPNSLLKIINYGQYIDQPFLKKIPKSETIDSPKSPEAAFYKSFNKVKQLWLASAKQEVEQLLINSKDLKRNKYSLKYIPLWCQKLNEYLTARSISINLPDPFIRFTCSEIAQAVKKNCNPPQHQFFDLCQQLYDSHQILASHFEQRLVALKLKLFAEAETALAQKKYQFHLQSFDDLLTNLHKALKEPNGHGHHLTRLIHNKFNAALIDEFQDTDRVQYEIFNTVFGSDNSILFLIGDPKQAIYSFRGADIFTYIEAKDDATRRYTLVENWRSQADLIDAVNQIFKQNKQAFIFKDIPFQPVEASKRVAYLKIENQTLPPLQLWFVSRNEIDCQPNKLINKAWGNTQIPNSVANEIARLLMLAKQEQAMIGTEPLRARDIAILVRTNKQARYMQQVLTKLQIPSVLYSRDNLFTSDEVVEIELVLQAIADPSNENLIKAALTTDMLGVSGNELYQLMNDDRAWQQYLSRFQEYNYQWQNVGFIQMYHSFLLKEQVQTRLLNYPDGERRLTNILHLAEILQELTMKQQLSMGGVCQWLSQQRQQPDTNNEEQQLRLESDEKRVKIVTIHKSKGLEYPIVFCPFIWDGYLHHSKDEQFVFHDENNELTLDLGSKNQQRHREQALEEERAENLRLFYVAVTRAKHRCYLVWGAFKDAGKSALAHLLHPDIDVEKVEDNILWQQLKSNDKLEISHLPLDVPPKLDSPQKDNKLKNRKFSGEINKEWKISSFSSLSNKPNYTQPQNYDIIADKTHIYNFPRGAKAGQFMHSLFENIDFQAPSETVITTQLSNFGYEVEQWQDTIIKLINNVTNTPLIPDNDLTLSKISRDKRLNELEFFYPTLPERGFMKGYIDMVFEYQGRYYLIDYKSHMLGNYHHSALNKIIARENYILQYRIYTTALHRYLSSRLPNYNYEQHFGGVYYLFLRGMTPETGADFGVYRDMPDLEVVD